MIYKVSTGQGKPGSQGKVREKNFSQGKAEKSGKSQGIQNMVRENL